MTKTNVTIGKTREVHGRTVHQLLLQVDDSPKKACGGIFPNYRGKFTAIFGISEKMSKQIEASSIEECLEVVRKFFAEFSKQVDQRIRDLLDSHKPTIH